MNKKYLYLSLTFAFLLIICVFGLTYAFFNYTRTGAINNLGTGRINFSSTQGEALTINNVFPMTATEAGNATLDTVTVGVMGDTTYSDGEEFEITLVDVTNTVNGKEIPINYIATYEAATGGSIGGSNSDYWDDREDKDANIYLLNSEGSVIDGKQVLVGYIKNGSTGISGTLSISAYIDADRIAISDTYYENAPSPSPTASPLASPNGEYGTTTEWVDGRVVLTTDEWNSLTSNPISFKIKAESNEGIWANPQIESCIGCKFIHTTNEYLYSANNYASSPSSTLATFESNNETLVDDYRTLNKNIFLGFKFDGSGNITNGYACGIKGEDPNNGTAFCIEGTQDDSSGGNSKKRKDIRNANSAILESLYGSFDSERGVGCRDSEYAFTCDGAVYSYTGRYGMAFTAVYENNHSSDCSALSTGGALCS